MRQRERDEHEADVEAQVNSQMNGERGQPPFAFEPESRRKPKAGGSEQRHRIPDSQLLEYHRPPSHRLRVREKSGSQTVPDSGGIDQQEQSAHAEDSQPTHHTASRLAGASAQ